MNWTLVIGGLVVHLIFFYSIFDIYFTSPLVHGMTPHSTAMSPPARRLILFVMDGCRADKLLELDDQLHSRAPFLRNILKEEGAWGISHTHVPTESRPGHVALIAGFYEDVSAVAKGWKENPVEFDSVFNESRHTWSWGSPDILPMFAKAAHDNHVHAHSYASDAEDFGGADSSKLDTWVFDRVKEFLAEAKRNMTLRQMFRQDKVILFLHLLGIDTNGHAHKPYSHEYLENIAIADAGIREIHGLIEDFFEHDGQTAYVATSDHGMTNWGSHGAGHTSETLTPLIAWGAGVRGPKPSDNHPYPDGYEKEWHLGDLKRTDVNQADVAALMASLIGVPFPLNSVGMLPLDFLNTTDQFKAEAIFANAEEILAQFVVKMHQKRSTTLSVFFTPFKPLTPSIQADRLRQTRRLIQGRHYNEAISQSLKMIELALRGLTYYHTYDRIFFGFCIAMAFIGWIGFLVTLILQHTLIIRPRHNLDLQQRGFWRSEKGIRLAFTLLGVVVVTLLYIQSQATTHYIYCLLPVVIWHKVFQRADVFVDLYYYIVDHGYVKRTIVAVLMGICGLEIIILGFFWRQLLSVGLLGIALWPLSTHLAHSNRPLVLRWILSCLLLAVFPLLPVVGRQPNYNLVYLAGVLAFTLALFLFTRPEILMHNKHTTSEVPLSRWHLHTFLQLFVLLLAVFITWSTAVTRQAKQGLSAVSQITSWAILASSLVLPLVSSSHMYTRLLSIAVSFLPPFLLLSTAHEGLFYLALSTLLVVWVQLEHGLQTRKLQRLSTLWFSDSLSLVADCRKLEFNDIQCAYVFIYLLLTAFFGTGNIASINSFDPASVLCFLTVFSPFTMAALMMWKIIVPFLLVTCAFNAVHLSINVPTQSLFLLVLLMSDYMAMHFFFLVKDYGSWLDIGTSISHYVIVMVTILILFALLSLSRIFTNFSLHVSRKWHRH